ncbi:hypothetical protein LV28_25485 [Pandoraea pnomenusa]|uniref:Phage regulatory protein CII (CP76) n=1 Tax=Pandoraea pnomenusa TaxID=93220 RepID=A0A378YTF0_9BURK|nr:phage regulatory CII family protein [Pandoraea pnomenusa]ALR36080.1 hypothetical protein LV28_25485 [Pandoraea pnomenusa]MBN9093936.1 phage regulatory CII family protein [Pandoraea pnomenusa]SUA80432.1 Uncharacterised protein [Pandoraea pnomenusa]
MTRRYNEINQHDALYLIARAYPGGVEALAQRMGKSVNVLRNKLRPDIDTHHVTFEEATEITELCTAARVREATLAIDAAEWRLGRVAIQMPVIEEAGDQGQLATALGDAIGRIGAVAEKVSESIRNDGVIDCSEHGEIEKLFQECLHAVSLWRANVTARHQSDMTASGRPNCCSGD